MNTEKWKSNRIEIFRKFKKNNPIHKNIKNKYKFDMRNVIIEYVFHHIFFKVYLFFFVTNFSIFPFKFLLIFLS